MSKVSHVNLSVAIRYRLTASRYPSGQSPWKTSVAGPVMKT